MKIQIILFALITVTVLGACGGGDSDSSSPSTSSSSGSDCNYKDQISASERDAANACGIQVSGNYAQADSGLQSVVAACQKGEKAKADAYYTSTYAQMVSYARSVADTLSCRTSTSSPKPTSPTLPNTSQASFYNFCVRQTAVAGKITYEGSCSGPFQQFSGACASGYSTNIGQYSSQSACMTAGQAWVNTH